MQRSTANPCLASHRFLTKTSLLTGVKSYDVNLEKQTADVTAEDKLAFETVLEKIKKTGKTVNSAEADGVTKAVV